MSCILEACLGYKVINLRLFDGSSYCFDSSSDAGLLALMSFFLTQLLDAAHKLIVINIQQSSSTVKVL